MEIQSRKKKAWANFWGLKIIFKGKMRVKTKIRTLRRSTMPVLTYGSQT